MSDSTSAKAKQFVNNYNSLHCGTVGVLLSVMLHNMSKCNADSGQKSNCLDCVATIADARDERFMRKLELNELNMRNKFGPKFR